MLADVAGARAGHRGARRRDDTGEVLGCVTFVLAGLPVRRDRRAGRGEFRMLAVAPTAQGRGVGAALVRACLDRATRAMHGRGDLYARHDDRAMRLYERFGFVRVPEQDWAPDPDIELLKLLLTHPA